MGITFFDGGTVAAWLPPLTTPVLSDYAWINQGGATATEQYGGITLYEAGHGNTTSVRVLKKAAPSTPYVITAGIVLSQWYAKNYQVCGLCFRESSSGKLHTFGLLNVSATGNLYSAKFTDANTYSTDYMAGVTITIPVPVSGILWLRIADNGTSRICSWSGDGFTWMAAHTVGRTDFLTANEVGFFVDAWNTNVPNMDTAIHLIHWEES